MLELKGKKTADELHSLCSQKVQQIYDHQDQSINH